MEGRGQELRTEKLNRWNLDSSARTPLRLLRVERR
jgi:hypothetical protein